MSKFANSMLGAYEILYQNLNTEKDFSENLSVIKQVHSA